MNKVKQLLIIIYCVCIGTLLNEKWFKQNKSKTIKAWDKTLFHASYIGFKIKQIGTIVIPTMFVLIMIHLYI